MIPAGYRIWAWGIWEVLYTADPRPGPLFSTESLSPIEAQIGLDPIFLFPLGPLRVLLVKQRPLFLYHLLSLRSKNPCFHLVYLDSRVIRR